MKAYENVTYESVWKLMAHERIWKWYKSVKNFKNVEKQAQCLVILMPGCFFARFQKTQGRLQKTQANFWPKTQRYGGNFEYQEKNSKSFDRNIQNLFKSSWDFQHICIIFQVLNHFLWNSPPKTNEFSKKISNVLKKLKEFPKKLKEFPKKTQGFEKNSKFWRQCASGCLPIIGQKKALK